MNSLVSTQCVHDTPSDVNIDCGPLETDEENCVLT